MVAALTERSLCRSRAVRFASSEVDTSLWMIVAP